MITSQCQNNRHLLQFQVMQVSICLKSFYQVMALSSYRCCQYREVAYLFSYNSLRHLMIDRTLGMIDLKRVNLFI